MAKYSCKRFFPINDSKELREAKFSRLTDAEITRWRIFRSYITRTPFMVNLLAQHQQSLCPICNKLLDLDRSVVHHIDYAYLCHYDGFLKIRKSTPKNPNRIIRIAKCEFCDNRTGCLERIILIHKKCHIYLHVKEGRKSSIKKSINDERQLSLF